MRRLVIVSVLTLIFVLSVLVNDIERPFARSLVVCDTDVDASPHDGLPSGSKMCGDRLFVIGEGSRFSGAGQSLEMFCSGFTTLLIAAISDRFGRRITILLCVTALTLSCCLFVSAAVVPSWASWFFIIGQGLQGFLNVDMLIALITTDLAQLSGADGPAIFTFKEIAVNLGELLGGLPGAGIQAQELQDYFHVWVGILALSVLTLMFAFFFPETRPNTSVPVPSSLGAALMAEFRSYQRLLTTPVIRWMLLQSILFGPLWNFVDIFPAMLMAYFGYSQSEVTVRFVAWTVLSLACTPLCLAACGPLGYRRAFNNIWRFRLVQLFLIGPAIATHPGALWTFLVVHSVLGGQVAIDEAIRAKVVGTVLSAKFVAMDQMCSQFMSSVSAYTYGELFDAKATSYVARTSSVLFCLAFLASGYAVYCVKVAPTFAVACDELTEAESEESTSTKKD